VFLDFSILDIVDTQTIKKCGIYFLIPTLAHIDYPCCLIAVSNFFVKGIHKIGHR
jgi:hypothetical protein